MAAKSSILVLVLSCGAVVPSAAAQDALEEASAAYDDGAFDRALELYRRALDDGGHPRDRLARIHHRLGTLLAAVGEDAAARGHFDVALAIEPSLAPPAELGPERRALFDDVRARRRAPLRIDAAAMDPPRPEDTRLAVEIEGAPTGAIAHLRIRVTPPGGAPWVEERPASSGAVTVAVPAAAWRASDRVIAEIDALDAHGSVLASTSLPLVAEAVGAPVAATSGGDVTAEPWFWPLVIGAAVVVVAVAIAVPVGVATQPRDRYVLVGF